MSTKENTTGMHVWLVLWKAYKALEVIDRRSITSLGLGGLSDFAILEILWSKGPSPVNTIGKTIKLTSGSITTAVDRAEAKGLVERSSDPKDRRVVMIDLTESGRQLIEENMEKHAAALEEISGVLSKEERSSLIKLLKKIGKHAESLA